MSSSGIQLAKSQESQTITVDRSWFMPDDLTSALKVAEVIAGSSLCPANYRNKPGDVFVAAKFGEVLGLSIMQSVIGICVINGRPGIFGDDQLAVVQSHPAYEWHKEFWEGEGDNFKAVCLVKRRGHDEHRSEFSILDAKTAHLWDERQRIKSRDGQEISNPAPWHCYPKRMLMFRARGFALRDKFADAVRGMKSVEELGDYPQTIEAEVVYAESPAGAKSATEDPAITPEKVNELAQVLKASGYTDKSGREIVREWLKSNCGVETTTAIKQSQFEKVLAWAKTPRAKAEQKSETKTEDKSQKKPRGFDPLFEQLGWTAKEREEYLGQMFKFSDGQIRADLESRIAQKNKADLGEN